MTVPHAELLAENGEFTVTTVTDENGALGGADHDLRILTLVDEALCDVIVHVELALVTKIDCKVLPVELPRIAEQEFSLFFRKKKLAVG